MNFTVNRDALLKPLILVFGAIERKHANPILTNVLIQIANGTLSLTGSDLEIELLAKTSITNQQIQLTIAVPAKKLLDICKSLPDGIELTVSVESHSLILSAGKGRYVLSILDGASYPNIDQWQPLAQLDIKSADLRGLIESTYFAMANQDVRYYLNGMYVEIENNELRSVATDGHRLAMCSIAHNMTAMEHTSIIIPKKGIMELMRLITEGDDMISVLIGENHLKLINHDFQFTSKLVDGRFPDYRRVIPQDGNKVLVAQRELLKDAFLRVSILSNEQFRGVRLTIQNNELHISANNPAKEQADESVEVDYLDEPIEIGFNVSYILDVLNNLKCDEVKFTFAAPNRSALIEAIDSAKCAYVIMPMKL